MKTALTNNIKISIAEIIISFEFDYQPFESKLRKTLGKFIVETDKVDINIKLNMVEEEHIVSSLSTDIINNKIATISNWDIKGELNLNNNNGIIYVYKGLIDFFTLLKFILLNSLPKFKALLLHSSTIFNHDFGIIGFGVSGSGKSTFAKKLENERFTIMHDEITLIREINGYIYVFPVPFNYNPKHIVNFSKPKRLKLIFIIKQNENDYLKPVSLKYFYKEILKVIFSYNKLKNDYYGMIFDIINKLYINHYTNVSELSFNLENNLSEIIYSIESK